jgi:hypothetical protein
MVAHLLSALCAVSVNSPLNSYSNAARTREYCDLPKDRVVELGRAGKFVVSGSAPAEARPAS